MSDGHFLREMFMCAALCVGVHIGFGLTGFEGVIDGWAESLGAEPHA